MDTTLSPLVQTDLRRQKMALDRANRMKTQLVPWGIVLSLLCFEVWCNCVIGDALFSSLIPLSVIIVLESCLLIYVLTVVLWMAYISTNPLFATKAPPPSPLSECNLESELNRSILNRSINQSLNTSLRSRSDTSWVESHQFGASPGARQTVTPNKSILNSSMLNSSNLSPAEVYSDVSMSSGAQNKSKLLDSIHTREQLERYLRKNPTDSSRLDLSSSSLLNGSLGYYNMLDIGSGDRKGYQLSEELKPAEGKENLIKFGQNGRVMLSTSCKTGDEELDEMGQLREALLQAKNSPRKSSLRRDSIGGRRRSHSSPDRQLSSSGTAPIPEVSTASARLDDADLERGEYRLRFWIVNTVISPLAEQIRKVNATLEKEHANPPLRVGVSSVDALRAALTTRPSLCSTALPFLLPYLSTHSNQAYLVSRVKELSADQFMSQYKANSGGCEPTDEKASNGSRVSRRAWSEALPSDSSLVASLFSAYMDSRLTSNPLVGSASLDQPFSAVYIVRAPQKPQAVHMAKGSFYLHLTSASPATAYWEMVSTDSSGSTVRAPITKGNANLFHAILQLIHHAKVANNGRIDALSIGPTGLNLACVLD